MNNTLKHREKLELDGQTRYIIDNCQQFIKKKQLVLASTHSVSEVNKHCTNYQVQSEFEKSEMPESFDILTVTVDSKMK